MGRGGSFSFNSVDVARLGTEGESGSWEEVRDTGAGVGSGFSMDVAVAVGVGSVPVYSVLTDRLRSAGGRDEAPPLGRGPGGGRLCTPSTLLGRGPAGGGRLCTTLAGSVSQLLCAYHQVEHPDCVVEAVQKGVDALWGSRHCCDVLVAR